MSTGEKLQHSFSMEELEIILNSELNRSQINDDILNSSTASHIEPSDSNKFNVLALAMTKTVKENIDLRIDVDTLQNLIIDNQRSQAIELENMRRTMHQLMEDKLELRNGLVDLHIKVNERENDMLRMDRQIDTLDRDLMDLQQYIRRPTIEISGIPDHIEQRDLESYVINQILQRTLGYTLHPMAIVACHRLKKRNPRKPANVVCRFVNRKLAIDAISGRNKLKTFPHLRRIYIHDNLCPRYKEIFDKLSELKRERVVNHVWSFNGKVHYKQSDNRWVRGTRVFHMNDLEPLIRAADMQKIEREALEVLENEHRRIPRNDTAVTNDLAQDVLIPYLESSLEASDVVNGSEPVNNEFQPEVSEPVADVDSVAETISVTHPAVTESAVDDEPFADVSRTIPEIQPAVTEPAVDDEPVGDVSRTIQLKSSNKPEIILRQPNERTIVSNAATACQFCRTVFESVDDLQFHRVNSCPAIEDPENSELPPLISNESLKKLSIAEDVSIDLAHWNPYNVLLTVNDNG